MAFYIRKADGTKQEFSIKKFRRSLKKSGASPEIINNIIEQVFKRKPKSTKEIHTIASEFLEHIQPSLAARYNLKRALMELGPSGYPFEQFIGKLFIAQGYKTRVSELVSGACVDHEIDVIAVKDNDHFMVECKFHNRPGLKSDVKVALYIRARFEDLQRASEHGHKEKFSQAYMVTNTKFTSIAEQYAKCMNMQMLSWAWPNGGIAALVDKFDLHPVTALTGLTKKQKKQFIKNGFVLCKDAPREIGLLKSMGFTDHEIDKLVQEATNVCKLK